RCSTRWPTSPCRKKRAIASASGARAGSSRSASPNERSRDATPSPDRRARTRRNRFIAFGPVEGGAAASAHSQTRRFRSQSLDAAERGTSASTRCRADAHHIRHHAARAVHRTQRHLTRHAGQVSFPGGRADDTDVSLVQTALRETHEETGIEPTFVTVAGFLDTYETGSGYAILPVVGVLSEGFALRPGAAEVERIFEVPLAFLLDAKNREQGHGQWQGHKRTYYTYHYAGHRIWGATAAMVVNF